MNKQLIDRVISFLEEEIVLGDTTVLEELLGFIPAHLLRGALSEEEWKNWPLPEEEAEILDLKTELVQTLIEHRDRLDEIITHLDPMALVNDSLKKLNA